MDDSDVRATTSERLAPKTRPHPPGQIDDWITRLATNGPVRDEAVEQLLDLMIRGARHQVSRMPEAAGLGQARRDEIVLAAADQATVAVLSRLDSFEGRSRFTTWAYKFAILHAAAEVRCTAWRSREIDLLSVPEPVSEAISPEDFAEARTMTAAVRRAIAGSLTAHQQRVIVALVVDGVPIDVLAERLHTNRNALYKTLHDARRRLREELIAQGYLEARQRKEVSQ